MSKTTTMIKKVVAMMLMMAMVISVLAIGGTDEVKAASGLTFKSKGTSTVKLTGAQIGKPQYIKFKAGVTGTITLTFKATTSTTNGELQLLNAKKKALASKETWRASTMYETLRTRTYGVKKGKTYYFLVTTDQEASVTATVKAVKKYNCTSKKTAKTIKRGKTVTSVLIAGQKKADWYKFKVSKTQNFNFIVSVKTNGYPKRSLFEISFYDSNGKVLNTNYSNTRLITSSKISISIRAPKGTCYAKVKPYTTSTSGQYSITWAK